MSRPPQSKGRSYCLWLTSKLRPWALTGHGFKKMELAGMAFVFKVDGIIAAEASIAKTPTLAVEISVHPFSTEIRESVGLDETADLFD